MKIDDEMFYKQSILLLEKELIRKKLEILKLKEEILNLRSSKWRLEYVQQKIER